MSERYRGYFIDNSAIVAILNDQPSEYERRDKYGLHSHFPYPHNYFNDIPEWTQQDTKMYFLQARNM